MENIDLVKIAVDEWKEKKLTSDEAMLRISMSFSIKRPPSKECTEWATDVIERIEKKLGLK